MSEDEEVDLRCKETAYVGTALSQRLCDVGGLELRDRRGGATLLHLPLGPEHLISLLEGVARIKII